MENFLAEQMKAAMRRLAGSVTVLTAGTNGKRLAMLATAVNSLSLDPPSLVICVNRFASLYAPLAAGVHFCVNILGSEHEDLASHCSRAASGEDRFAVGNWLRHVNGVPYLADAQAALICKPDGLLPYGTHGIFVGRVSDIFVRPVDQPLIYFDGRYIGPCSPIALGRGG